MIATLEKGKFDQSVPESKATLAPGASASKNIGYSERLDHLRFVAALLVILIHCYPVTLCEFNHLKFEWPSVYQLVSKVPTVLVPLKALIFEGHTGVGLFMTLSGFLFARIADGKNIAYRNFFINRVLRIYPLYVCAIMLAVYLAPANNGLLAIATSMLCLQNLPSGVTHELLTQHLWTIAVEFQFYLLFPLLVGIYRKGTYRSLLLVLALSLLVKALVYGQTHNIHDLAYMTLVGRIDTFLIGMLFGFAYPRMSARLAHPLVLLAAVVLAVGAITVFHLKGGMVFTERKAIWIFWPAIEALVWGAVIAAYSASSWSLPRSVSRPLAFLGTLSFSIYVTHFFFSYQLPRWIAPWVDACMKNPESPLRPLFLQAAASSDAACLLFVLFVVVPCTVAFSTLTYFAIEKPFMDMRVKYTS